MKKTWRPKEWRDEPRTSGDRLPFELKQLLLIFFCASNDLFNHDAVIEGFLDTFYKKLTHTGYHSVLLVDYQMIEELLYKLD